VTENGLERDAGHVLFLISASVIEGTTWNTNTETLASVQK
jgi:hypothetical protein